MKRMGRGAERKDKIVVIGAAILDVLVRPAEPEVFNTGSFGAEQIKMSFGGDAINESIILASFGKKVYLNTVFGKDPEGEIIKSRCDGLGIELSEHCQQEGLQTGINVVLVQNNGERHFLSNRNGSLRKLGKKDISLPFPEDAGILSFASMFVSPEFLIPDMTEIFRQAKAQGMTVCADMTKRKNGETTEDLAEALAYVDYLLPNEEEACLLTGKDTVEDAAKALKAAGVKTVVIKCGKRGCYVLEGEEGYYVPAVEGVTCVDTTGAGDSFVAGFLYGLSEGWEIRACAEFANQCGARAVAHVGATAWCENGSVEEMKHIW